jgi:hypothetical protein
MPGKNVRFHTTTEIREYELAHNESSEKRICWKTIKIKIPIIIMAENLIKHLETKRTTYKLDIVQDRFGSKQV